MWWRTYPSYLLSSSHNFYLLVVLVYAMGSYLDFPVSGLFTAMSNSIWNFLLVSDFLIYKNFFVYDWFVNMISSQPFLRVINNFFHFSLFPSYLVISSILLSLAVYDVNCPQFSLFSHSVKSNSLQPMYCSTPGFPVHHQLPELAQTHVHWVGDAIQPSHPLSSPSPPTFNLSQHQGLFQWVSSSHQVAKVLEFSFSVSPSDEYSGLISYRMDWLDLLAVQGTLKGLLQHHSSKASIPRPSAFFVVQLSHPYMTNFD